MTEQPAGWWRRTPPLAIAHRGQRATVPEQTLEAYQAAIDLGCDAIECDVQRTRDGRLVMLHDLTVDRTTDGEGPVAAIGFAELRQLDAGSWFGGSFAGCRVPTLDETIDLAVRAGVPLCIEIKGEPPDAAETAIAVVDVLRERDLLDAMFVSSFDHDALAAATRSAPGLLLAPERLPYLGPADSTAAVRQATELGAAVLQHHWEFLTAAVVDDLHRAGVAVWSWPIDSPEAVAHSMTVGVDAVIGDDVALLLRELGRTVVRA